MDDLVTWLRAQLDEDERVAKKAGEAMGFDDPSFPDYRTYDGWELEAADAFIAHLSPARVLREVESKRRILDEVISLIDQLDAQIESEWGSGGYNSTGESDALVKLLALPFADRPGYQEAWKP